MITTPPTPPSMRHVMILLDYMDAVDRRRAAEAAAAPVAVELAAEVECVA